MVDKKNGDFLTRGPKTIWNELDIPECYHGLFE